MEKDNLKIYGRNRHYNFGIAKPENAGNKAKSERSRYPKVERRNREKLTLSIYRKWKAEIKEKQVYDNTSSSIMWHRARSNCLNLENRKRHQGVEITCKICN